MAVPCESTKARRGVMMCFTTTNDVGASEQTRSEFIHKYLFRVVSFTRSFFRSQDSFFVGGGGSVKVG